MAIEIITGLYLGNKIDAYNVSFLQSRHINIIINTTTEIPFFKECPNLGIESIRVPISDSFSNSEKDKHINEYYYQLPELCILIDKKLQKFKNILIHCKYGKFRSSCLVLAYLMYKTQMPLERLYGLMRSKYPLLKMRKHIYLDTLIKWEEEINNKKNIT